MLEAVFLFQNNTKLVLAHLMKAYLCQCNPYAC